LRGRRRETERAIGWLSSIIPITDMVHTNLITACPQPPSLL
jgi:hypothetical protein